MLNVGRSYDLRRRVVWFTTSRKDWRGKRKKGEWAKDQRANTKRSKNHHQPQAKTAGTHETFHSHNHQRRVDDKVLLEMLMTDVSTEVQTLTRLKIRSSDT